MKRRVRWAIGGLGVLALAALGACVGSDPDLVAVKESADAAPGGGAEGSTTADVASPDAGADADLPGGSLLTNGNFELGCLGWSGLAAALVEEPSGRAGKACRVCKNERQAYYYVKQELEGPIAKGDRFIARAYVRATTDKPAPSVEVLVVAKNQASVEVDRTQVGNTSATTVFQEVSGLHVTKSSEGVTLVVQFGVNYVGTDDESCFVIDDATLSRLP